MFSIPRDFEIVKFHLNQEMITRYTDSLPYRSHCTDQLGFLYNLPKELALSKRYLQHNPPGSISTLIIDHDDPESHYKWDDLHAPPPQYAVMNPENGHSHLLYLIRNKIYKNRASNLKPFRLLSGIERALIKKLGADPSYINFISKNPLHKHWHLIQLQDWVYDLSDFFQWLDVPQQYYSEDTFFDSGLGRNCTVFDLLRHRAYSLIRELNFKISLDLFINELFVIALHKINGIFQVPLDNRELFGIAKSVGKWVYTHYSNDEFIAFCSRRGKKSGKVRLEKASQLYREIKEIKINRPDMSNRAIARLLQIDPKTIRNALKYFEPTKDDNELFIDQPSLYEE